MSRFFRNLVHKEIFGFMWQIVFKLKYLFDQGRQETSFVFEWTCGKVASDNYSR